MLFRICILVCFNNYYFSQCVVPFPPSHLPPPTKKILLLVTCTLYNIHKLYSMYSVNKLYMNTRQPHITPICLNYSPSMFSLGPGGGGVVYRYRLGNDVLWILFGAYLVSIVEWFEAARCWNGLYHPEHLHCDTTIYWK